MSKHLLLALGALLLASASTASAQNLTEAQARAIIAPWYSLFNVATRGDVKSIQEQVLPTDYESCAGYLPDECWGRDTSIKVVGNFAKSIPDMKFDIKEVLVADDRVVVRGEVTGTPAGELFGVPSQRQELPNDGHRYSNHQRWEDREDLPHGELAQRAGTAPRKVNVQRGGFGRQTREISSHSVSTKQESAMSMKTKPSIVFAHGLWADG